MSFSKTIAGACLAGFFSLSCGTVEKTATKTATVTTNPEEIVVVHLPSTTK
jgi:copper oxidase (laccase) domain-containing protein